MSRHTSSRTTLSARHTPPRRRRPKKKLTVPIGRDRIKLARTAYNRKRQS
ncbi:MAG: hypothetical protein ACJ768_17305 [Gaiellaceae bacterium]